MSGFCFYLFLLFFRSRRDGGLTLPSTLIKDLKTTTMSARPTLGKMLGVLRYDKHANALKEVVECLLECVDAAVSLSLYFFSVLDQNLSILQSPAKFHVEARKTCYEAIPRVLGTIVDRLPKRTRILPYPYSTSHHLQFSHQNKSAPSNKPSSAVSKTTPWTSAETWDPGSASPAYRACAIVRSCFCRDPISFLRTCPRRCTTPRSRGS